MAEWLSCANWATESADNDSADVVRHSEDVSLDNGVGYLSDIANIHCNNEMEIRFDVSWFVEDVDTSSVRDSILYEYDAAEFPCSGVSVLCGNRSCDMTYLMHLDVVAIELSDFEDEAQCFRVEMQTMQQPGQCEQSPTESPTDRRPPLRLNLRAGHPRRVRCKATDTEWC